MEKKLKLIDPVKRIITGLIEIDQELAVLEVTYRPSAKDRSIKRIDESLAALSNLRELIRDLNKDAYIEKT